MGKDLAGTDHCILFCNGGSCKRQGSEEMIREVRAHLRMEVPFEDVHTIKTLCMGHCKEGPYACILPDNVWYKDLSVKDGIDMVESHIKQGKFLEEKLLYHPEWERMRTEIPTLEERLRPVPFEREASPDRPLKASARFKEGDIYPMLKAAFERHLPIRVKVPERDITHDIDEEREVHFDGRTARVELPREELTLRIGPLPPHEKHSDEGLRIRYVEALCGQKGRFPPSFRFRNENGTPELLIQDRSDEHGLWDHVLRTYFEQDPEQHPPYEAGPESMENERTKDQNRNG